MFRNGLKSFFQMGTRPHQVENGIVHFTRTLDQIETVRHEQPVGQQSLEDETEQVVSQFDIQIGRQLVLHLRID